jgi:5-oxoprolinase (ATP-hydrolysing)/N-methylhydantoinase A
MKLAREGVPNEDLFALIGENVRNPWQVIGDIHSMMTANSVGAERLAAFMDEYGMHDLQALALVVQNRAEAATRAAIRAIPDGVYTSSISNNPLGEELTYPLKVTVAGDAIELDFEGTPAQLPRGGLNCTLNYTEAHATYPLKCMLSPNVRGNAGCYRPFTVKAPEGSMLNCTKPASVYLRTRTGWYIAPNVFRAMSQAAPDQVQAMTGLPVSVGLYGWDAENRLYADHLFMGGGQGASMQGDGKSALLWPTSAANTSIELLEQRVPVLVEEKTYVTDSSGAGRHRGGLGQRVRVRKLHDDGLPTLAPLYPEGVHVATPGLFDGQPGAKAWGGVRNKAGTVLHDSGTGELVTLTRPDEIAEIVLCGGAGFGDPMERSLAAVARDLADGCISPEAAARDYGAVLREDGTLDEQASHKRRDASRAAAE